MVDFAAKRVAARGLSDRIATQQADAQSLTALKVRSSRRCWRSSEGDWKPRQFELGTW